MQQFALIIIMSFSGFTFLFAVFRSNLAVKASGYKLFSVFVIFGIVQKYLRSRGMSREIRISDDYTHWSAFKNCIPFFSYAFCRDVFSKYLKSFSIHKKNAIGSLNQVPTKATIFPSPFISLIYENASEYCCGHFRGERMKCNLKI